ncbi:unnamed protein product [Onchocerca ochengi]|uniref:Detected protein of confused Function n=1 Tax=Onchocerca ochengi TaxID=42157 RepID=A0A182EDB0_ONCOC|nr:unnamed protein product [Onchocerca ochengi]
MEKKVLNETLITVITVMCVHLDLYFILIGWLIMSFLYYAMKDDCEYGPALPTLEDSLKFLENTHSTSTYRPPTCESICVFLYTEECMMSDFQHGHCFGDEWWISKEDEGDDNENRLLPSLAREEDELSSVSDSVDEKLAVLIYGFSRLRIVNEAVENHKGAVADGGLTNSNETAKAAGNFQPTIRLKVSPDEFLEQLRALTAVGSISVGV